VALKAGANPLLVRYDRAGRGHFVLRRQGATASAARTPLAMRWHDDAGVIPFDVSAGERPAEWFRFTAAPGTSALRVRARGAVEAWLDGVPMKAASDGHFVAAQPAAQAAVVALRVRPERPGLSGGALIPEPVAVETDGGGRLTLGDWSKVGVLNNYSGGVRYRSAVALTAEEARARATLDLGRVAGTAEIWVNGKRAGVRVAPPWRQEVTGLLKAGENAVEVLVCNTLANHYQTIPSRYRGDPVSGLLGPVRLVSREWPASAGELASSAEAAAETEERGGLRYTCSEGQGKAAADNLLKDASRYSVAGKASHPGGGRDFAALFNGTALSGTGGAETTDDGRTFVGFAAGDVLTVTFARDVTLRAVQTDSGHHDGRASQSYEVWVAAAASPDRFERLASVSRAAASGIRRVEVARADGQPLARHVRSVRLLFQSGPAGFNVYRELALLGSEEK
jgi:hypothetical protein